MKHKIDIYKKNIETGVLFIVAHLVLKESDIEQAGLDLYYSRHIVIGDDENYEYSASIDETVI